MEKTARAELGEIIEFGPRLSKAWSKGMNSLGHDDIRRANQIRTDLDFYISPAEKKAFDEILRLKKRAAVKRGVAIAAPSLAATGAAGYMIGKNKDKNLSAREELDLILFRSPTLGELEKHEKKSSTAKNLAIAGGVTAGVGGLGYLAYKGGKAFGTAKEEAQKGSRAVRTILEDKLSPAIEEMKKVAIRGQEATEIPSFMGRRMGTVIENAKLAYQPGEAARASREAFREGLQKGVPAADKAKLPYAIARKLGRVAGRIGKWRATLGPFSAREELGSIIEFNIRERLKEADPRDNVARGAMGFINPGFVVHGPAGMLHGNRYQKEGVPYLKRDAVGHGAAGMVTGGVLGASAQLLPRGPARLTGTLIGGLGGHIAGSKLASEATLAKRKKELGLSARDELNLILFADPRPRNSLGMFSGGNADGMPNPNAMKIVYDPRRLQAGMPQEKGLMQIGRPIRRIMRR